MDNRIERFLEFKGHNLSLLLSDGSWWVAVKPICKALGIDYERQRQNIRSSQILGQLPAIQQVVGADNKMRKMLCLPEEGIYWWLASINSDNPDLVAYQWECYQIIANHFRGAITGRMKVLEAKTADQLRKEQLEEELKQTPIYQEIQQIEKRKRGLERKLRQLDSDLITGQMSMNLE